MIAVRVRFMDSGRTACPANPRYPKGVHIDFSHDSKRACLVLMPYPAPGCGYWIVSCQRCGQVNIVSAAGRADDPRTVKLRCNLD